MKASSIVIREHFISKSREEMAKKIQQKAEVYVQMMLEVQKNASDTVSSQTSTNQA